MHRQIDNEIQKNRRPSLNVLDFIQFGGPEDLPYERLNFSPVTESQFYFYSEICFDTYMLWFYLKNIILALFQKVCGIEGNAWQ